LVVLFEAWEVIYIPARPGYADVCSMNTAGHGLASGSTKPTWQHMAVIAWTFGSHVYHQYSIQHYLHQTGRNVTYGGDWSKR